MGDFQVLTVEDTSFVVGFTLTTKALGSLAAYGTAEGVKQSNITEDFVLECLSTS